MIKKHRFRLLIGITGLAAAALWYLNNDTSTLKKKDIQFAVRDPYAIDQIILQSNSDTLELNKMYGRWMIEDEETRPESVLNLLAIATQIQVHSPVSMSNRDAVLQHFSKGVQIGYYSNGKKKKSYQICQWNDHFFGKLDRSQKTFRIAVRGYSNTDLMGLFSLKRGQWINNMLLDFLPGEIQTVFVYFPSKTNKSFGIQRHDKNILHLTDKSNNNLTEKVHPHLLTEYLNSFTNIRYTTLPDSAVKAVSSVFKDEPLFTLAVKTLKNEQFIVSGYPKKSADSGKTDPFEFYAPMPGNGVFVLKYSDFDPILVDLDYFLK